MRTLAKVLFWWVIAGLVVSVFRGSLTTALSEQEEKKQEVLTKLMMSYPPRTQEQIACLKRPDISNVLLETNGEERVVQECKLQKLTQVEQARLESEVAQFKTVMSIQDQQKRFNQLALFYSTHPNLWEQYVNFCREPARTEATDCDYYLYVQRTNKSNE